MAIEIKVPVLPESVADATVAKWYKKEGDRVERDEHLVDLETDKVMLEVPAAAPGVMGKIIIGEGKTVKAGTVLATLIEAEAQPAAKAAAKTKEEKTPAPQTSTEKTETPELSPAVRRLVSEHNLDASKITPSGKSGRLTKEDVARHLQSPAQPEKTQAAAPVTTTETERGEKRAPMSRLRARIAERLVAIQHEAALLTTFNEVNMQPVMELRKTYQEKFEKTHQVRLGFMSFFVKAAVEALKRFPIVNASVDGTDIIYHNYFDIGIAVGGGPRGLVVPIVRNADLLSMAEIEKQIHQFSDKVKNNKLTIEDMTGGTFTITNGGVFGS
ncbi:MAG: dihydrolipoyllysine-residue succinyltransferase, partial [Proteobacteria bacterium]|nr:dihydrolipoyllysine-residue succinyltransferase [Pseudomonadota bacterium]